MDRQILKEKGLDLKHGDIIPVAPYLPRYAETLSLPQGHDKKSLEILHNNFEKVSQDMRNHIEITQGNGSCGVNIFRELKKYWKNSEKKFSEVSKNLKQRYTEVEKSAVTPEKVEQVEKAEVFWG